MFSSKDVQHDISSSTLHPPMLGLLRRHARTIGTTWAIATVSCSTVAQAVPLHKQEDKDMKRNYHPAAVRIIDIAEDNCRYSSSARMALDDAIECHNNYDFKHARLRALDSLAHSVGIMSHIYINAVNLRT